MGGVTKYSGVMRANIMELYARGYSLQSCADYVGISKRTIQYWIKKYDLKEEMEAIRDGRAKHSIEVGLRRQAEGAEEVIVEKSFTTNRVMEIKEIDEDTGIVSKKKKNVPVNKTVKKKILPPSVKAIEVLSRKYSPEFDPKAEERELTSKLLDGFTMRELQEARTSNPIDKGKYIDAEFTQLSSEESNSSTNE